MSTLSFVIIIISLQGGMEYLPEPNRDRPLTFTDINQCIGRAEWLTGRMNKHAVAYCIPNDREVDKVAVEREKNVKKTFSQLWADIVNLF